MTSRIVFFSLLTLSIQFVYLKVDTLYAGEDFVPYVAVSTGKQVNVRAGQSSNFERLCQLKEGEEVVIVDKDYSWFKIQLPSSAKSYVSKKYIQFLGQNAGGVTANQVNIRAGAGTHFTVLGQLFEGEQIYIQEDLKDWYRIEPIAESYGWISNEFLTFKSEDVSGFQLKRPPIPLIDDAVEEAVIIEEDPVQESVKEIEETIQRIDGLVEKMSEDATKGIISVVGVVEPYEDEGENGIHYKIVENGKPVCYVQGVNHMLGRFINHQVSVDGIVNEELESRYSLPVVSVVKVRLML